MHDGGTVHGNLTGLAEGIRQAMQPLPDEGLNLPDGLPRAQGTDVVWETASDGNEFGNEHLRHNAIRHEGLDEVAVPGSAMMYLMDADRIVIRHYVAPRPLCQMVA
jgi:hypothetical protein